MVSRFVVALGVLLASPAAAVPVDGGAEAAVVRGTVLLDATDVARIRSRKGEFGDVLRSCAARLDYSPAPVETFAPDPHYTATGVNPTANNGKRLAADAQASYRAGLCYLLTGDVRFARTAQRVLDAWAGTLKRVANDQGRADVNFNLPYMIAAASWVRRAGGWDGASFDRFLVDVVLPNSTSANPNNHGAWGVLMEAAAAAHLRDAVRLERARARYLALLAGAVGPDGALTREIERSGTNNWRGGPDKGIKGMAYTHYFLLPASMAAKVFADAGRPVWRSEAGTLLGAAFRRAAAWTLHPETFPYYASNGGRLEAVRAASYFPLLLRYFPEPDAAAVMRQGDVGPSGFMLPRLFSGRPASSGRARG